MRVLFVKLTSMGDLIHALPALSDAYKAIPGIQFDWVIDKNFAEVATWHPAVNQAIPTRHRYWRKNWRQTIKQGELSQFIKNLRDKKYDLVIDGQTSMKSALVTLLSRGPSHGLNKHCASEWSAALAYRKSYYISKEWHALQRLRTLLANALNYPCPTSAPDYSIKSFPFPSPKFNLPKPFLVFVHNASWPSKMWPEHYWTKLIHLAQKDGFHILLPWGNLEEKNRAEKISHGFANATVLPFCSLSELAQILQEATGAICSDTGLCHLAAALDVPSITLYGSTDPQLIGSIGFNQIHIPANFECFKCYRYECNYKQQKQPEPVCLLQTKPETVWESFCKNLSDPHPENNYGSYVKS